MSCKISCSEGESVLNYTIVVPKGALEDEVGVGAGLCTWVQHGRLLSIMNEGKRGQRKAHRKKNT